MSGVSNVTNTSQTTATQNQTSQTNKKADTKKTHESNYEVANDEYAGSAPKVKTGNYNKDGVKVDMDAISAAKAEMKNNAGAFKMMVNAAHKGNNSHSLNSKDANYWSDFVYKQLGQQYTVEEAQELVSEDGYWGVEKTSDRIVEMAKSLSGGDISKYEELLGAIEKGFGAAKNEWGGKMPSITSKTYDAVMEKMKAWKEEAAAAQSTSTQGAATTVTQDAVKAAGGVSNE